MNLFQFIDYMIAMSLEIMKTDEKNRNRIGELNFCIEELKDYFLGENIYNTTDEMLMKYYDAYIC